MIKSFRCKETEKVFSRQPSRRFPPSMQRKAYRKLILLDAAEKLDDLRIPPGNRLDAAEKLDDLRIPPGNRLGKLSGDRKGQYTIRINDQFRVCFKWYEGNAYEVEIVDYH